MDPLQQFLAWYDEAMTRETADANAMALASVSADSRPSVRIVLYRGMSAGRLRFFTNQHSRKGRELDTNPWCAAVFHWSVCGRQVRIEGRAERLDGPENDAYFAARPLGHQVAATVSAQSQPVLREQLEAAFISASQRYGEGPVPRPAHWGGYGIVPVAIEFWQSVENRLHHRHRFQKKGELWTMEELAP
jgi:pyridoxamine 5'-phosphate oxidase